MKGIIITVLVTLAIASAFNPGMLRKLAQKLVHSKLNVSPAPSTEADINQVVKGNTDFAFNLFKTVDGRQENIIFSPYSVSVALGMTFAGSSGVTKSQIKNTLHFENPNTHAVFRDLNNKLFQYNKDAEVKIANSLWTDKNHKFNQDYIDVVRNIYGGEARSVDFSGAAEAARNDINSWTASKTNNKIQNVLDSRLPQDAKLVLVNTIYFKSQWQSEFNSADKEKFTLLNGNAIEVDMMKETRNFYYSETPKYQVVTIPYRAAGTFMTVILPAEGEFAEVKKNFNTESLYNHFNGFEWKRVEVRLPKFNAQTELNLKASLQELGMENPFTAAADFSRMDNTRNLFIKEAIHKAVIGVNEQGTEASAASVIQHFLSGGPQPKAHFIANRPFIYVIHGEHRSILFMGQVGRPTL